MTAEDVKAFPGSLVLGLPRPKRIDQARHLVMGEYRATRLCRVEDAAGQFGRFWDVSLA